MKRASLRHLKVMIMPNKINCRNISNYFIISFRCLHFSFGHPCLSLTVQLFVLCCFVSCFTFKLFFFCLLFEKHWKKCDLVRNLSHARKPVKCVSMGNKENTYICLAVNMWLRFHVGSNKSINVSEAQVWTV